MGTDPDKDRPFDNYYELLGVSESATRSAILAAYRELVKQNHPDITQSASDSDAEAGDENTSTPKKFPDRNQKEEARFFTHLSQAREILTSERKRGEYDRLGHEAYLTKYKNSGTVEPPQEETDAQSVSTRSREPHPSKTAAVDPTTSAGARGGTTAQTDGYGDGHSTAREYTRGVTNDEETPSVDDLISVDPVERAWTAYKQYWRARLAVTVLSLTLIPAALIIQNGSISLLGFALPLSISVAVVGASGLYAHIVLPVEDEPTEPATSASVGILRLDTSRTYLRRASIFGAVATALTISSGFRAPHSWSYLRGFVLGEQLTHPWIVPGLLDAPKLVSPANLFLTFLLSVSIIGVVVYGFLGVTGRVWLAYHADLRDSYPVIWDAFVTATIVSLGFTFLTGEQPFSPARFLPDFGLSAGFVNGTATSITLGTIALGSLFVLSVISLRLPLKEQ